MLKRFFAIFLACVMLSGCEARTAASSETPSSQSLASSQPPQSAAPAPIGKEPEPGPDPPAEEPSYIEAVALAVAGSLMQPGMGEFDMVKAAFDYIIETTTLDDPVGLDLWRIRGAESELPSFVKNRSLSVLLFGVGMCEDYAAALIMLLGAMGLEARYVPGLTYAADGSGFVHHAWAAAKVDGLWYHLDVQLEHNITRQGRIRYRYFMKGDLTMAASHRWGQNLIDTRLLTPEQNGEIAAHFIYEPCPQDYPEQPPHNFEPGTLPDIPALKAMIEAEFRAYEEIHGPLAPLELNIIPPVFALTGYPVQR